MPAIITDLFKKQMMQNILDETTSGSHNYYIAIGKSSQWDSAETVPTPTDTPRTVRAMRSAIQSMKKVEGTSYVVPRHNWTSGRVYSAYDDDLTTIPSNTYYVLTEENQVYICLQQGRDNNGTPLASTVKPSITDTVKPFKTSDGYKWKFLYTLSAPNANKFLSANFMPVEKQTMDSAKVDTLTGASNFTVIQEQQKEVDSNATPGQIIGVVVTNGGTGYTSSNPTVTIVGDGDSAVATATAVGGVITKIELDSSADSCMKMGHGYNFASITIAAPDSSGGTQATARAIFAGDSGMGADPRDELKATSLMFNIKPEGEGDAGTVSRKTFLIGKGTTAQNFRQVALIRNPFASDSAASGNLYAASTGLSLQTLRLTDSTQTDTFDIDKIVTGGTSGAKAVIDGVDITTGFHPKLIVHQDSALTGFLPFQEGENVTAPGGGSGTLAAAGVDADTNAFDVSDVNKTSGEILYIENRAPVSRASGQTEDIKVVITL